MVIEHTSQNPCVPPSAVSVRFPPSANGPASYLSPAWLPPPPGWLFGNWKITYSSQPGYLSEYNVQLDMYPLLPTNSSVPFSPHINLVSSQTVNSSNISTVYAIVKPVQHGPPFVFDFTATGYLIATNVYDVIAWGYDSAGNGYFVTYDGPTKQLGSPSDLTFYSRKEKGPTKPTLAAILKIVRAFDNSELTARANSVTKVPSDSRREGMLPVACDAGCMQNIAFKGSEL